MRGGNQSGDLISYGKGISITTQSYSVILWNVRGYTSVDSPSTTTGNSAVYGITKDAPTTFVLLGRYTTTGKRTYDITPYEWLFISAQGGTSTIS